MSLTVPPSWSADWRRHLPVIPPERQARLLAEASEIVSGLQAAAGLRGQRALHARCPYATANATLRVAPDLPEALRGGMMIPGAVYPVIARYSNANSRVLPDRSPDQRGLALRVVGPDGQAQDLLGTSGNPAHHAKDGPAMLTSLHAALGMMRGGSKVGALWTLVRGVGLGDARRMMRDVTTAQDHDTTLAALGFHSRAPFTLGPYAVKFSFLPIAGVAPALQGEGEQALTLDMVARLRAGPVVYRWVAHGFTTPTETPLDDHRVVWDRAPLDLGEVVLTQDAALTLAQAEAAATAIHPLSYGTHTRWDAQHFEPLGELNLLRAAYQASAAGSGRDNAAGAARAV